MSSGPWLSVDFVDVDLALDVNLGNVARIVARRSSPLEAGQEDPDEWLLEVGYLSGGSDVLYDGTRADVMHAREALFGALDELVDRVSLGTAIVARRRPTQPRG